MNFENIDTKLLRNSINNCINQINYSSSKQIISDITSNNIWSTSSRDNFKKSLEKLINVRYKNLEVKLNEYLKIVDKIEQYQAAYKNGTLIDSELINLNNQLLLCDPSDESNILNIKNQINSLNADKLNNDNLLTSLKNGIELLL